MGLRPYLSDFNTHDSQRVNRFAKLNKRSEDSSRLIKVLIKLSYLDPQDKLVASSSRPSSSEPKTKED